MMCLDVKTRFVIIIKSSGLNASIWHPIVFLEYREEIDLEVSLPRGLLLSGQTPRVVAVHSRLAVGREIKRYLYCLELETLFSSQQKLSDFFYFLSLVHQQYYFIFIIIIFVFHSVVTKSACLIIKIQRTKITLKHAGSYHDISLISI